MKALLVTAVTRLAAALLLAAPAATLANAQQAAYPNRPITWVVPFGTGTISDTSARLLAKAMSDRLGQAVVIENKPGAAGIVGTEYVAKAKPDGYTMIFATSSTMAVNPSIYKTLPYSPLESFIPVTGTTSSPMLLFANASKPYKTLEDFIDYMKKNPGKVNYGSAGNGTTPHLAGLMFQAATGTQMVHVPYKDSTSLQADLLAGTIDVVFDFPATMRPYIEAGKVVPLAIAREERLKSFPNVPSFKERGIDVVMTSWGSIAMPAGTPPEMVNRIAAIAAEASRDPVVLKFYEDNNTGSLADLGPARLKDFYVTESAKFKKLLEQAGVQPQ